MMITDHIGIDVAIKITQGPAMGTHLADGRRKNASAHIQVYGQMILRRDHQIDISIAVHVGAGNDRRGKNRSRLIDGRGKIAR